MGNVALFHLDDGPELGLLTSVWRGIKCPRLYAGDVQVAACPAFRAVGLEMTGQDGLNHVQHDVFHHDQPLSSHESMLLCVVTSYVWTPCALQDNAQVWSCSATSPARVVRLEALIAVLDVEECYLVDTFQNIIL